MDLWNACESPRFLPFSGRYHDIEVEDDVTAYLEYSDGMTAIFSASTGKCRMNRLEVVAEQGK